MRLTTLFARLTYHKGLNVLRLEVFAALGQAIARGEYSMTTGVLIVRNGEVAFENYFGDRSKERLNNTRSATKFLTAHRAPPSQLPAPPTTSMARRFKPRTCSRNIFCRHCLAEKAKKPQG
jgi:hypothetical protein